MGIQTRSLSIVLIVAVVGGVLAPDVAAQGVPGSGLGRPYWHVFLAYVIAWALVFGWVVSIARRLARIEKRLDD